jgi:hypothetical protein
VFDGLEACERNPATDDFELGYELALHDTMVDLLRYHMLANLPPCPHVDQMGPSGFLGEPLVSGAPGASLVSPSVTGRIPSVLWGRVCPRQTPLSLIKRELRLNPNGMKTLTACLRDAEHPTTKALEAMNVKYVGGKGRGAKSYLVKAA